MTCNGKWWGATKGEFRLLPESWTIKLWSSFEAHYRTYRVSKWDYTIKDETTPHSVKLGNIIYNFNFASGKPGSIGSIYYISEDGSHLIRVSTHWSGAVKAPRTIVCHWIKSCWWTIRGVGAASRYRNKWSVLGGIIAFSELEEL